MAARLRHIVARRYQRGAIRKNLIALSLPWSTSLCGITVMWLIAVAPTVDLTAFLVLLKRPMCIFPVALFALAVIGMLWSDAAWGAQLYAEFCQRQNC
jgi:hypothetical protein